MINFKTITVVVIVAILIGVLYVLFEKNFSGNTSLGQTKVSSSNQKATLKDQPPQQTSVITYPTPKPALPPINGSSNLPQEAENLQMRDYSGIFENLKDSLNAK